MSKNRKMLQTNVKTNKRKHGFNSKKTIELTLMTLPTVIMLFVFSYLPMVGLIIAFKDFRYDKGFLGSEWVGLRNFKFFFETNDAFNVLRNTVCLNFLFIILTLIASVTVALMLNEVRNKKMIKTVQTIMFFPYFMSWIVVGYLLYAFLNHNYGIINGMLTYIGQDTVSWYSNPKYWPFILSFVYLWKNVGYNSVIYYAALMGIDSEYYEAAELDGASRWQMTWKISLPMIKKVIIVMTILAIGKIMFSDFGMFFQLTRDQGALYSVTDVLDTYIYRALRVTGDVGVSSAVACFQALVGFALIVITNIIVKKFDEESALY